MSVDKHQVKLTKVEIEAALISVANEVVTQLIGMNNLEEALVDRFNYLSKRLLAIQAGKPEINNEPEQSENPAPSTSWS